MITITTQRERVLLVKLLQAEFAHAHSTNRMRSLGVVIVLVIAAVRLGLYALIVPCALCPVSFSLSLTLHLLYLIV